MIHVVCDGIWCIELNNTPTPARSNPRYTQAKRPRNIPGPLKSNQHVSKPAPICMAQVANRLLVYGRRIAASLEHGSKVTPRQGKLAF